MCLGLPGAMPTLSRAAILPGLRAVAALQLEPAPWSRFDRKHYRYPDLAKGYQITQARHPDLWEAYSRSKGSSKP